MNTDWTFLGTNVKGSVTNSDGTTSPRWTGTGNVFTLHLINTAATSNRQPYTVNAYSTPYFILGGVATASASSGTTPIAVAGIVGGYSSLTVGTDYYIDDAFDGTLTTDSTLDKVGKAISATEISLGDLS